MSKTRILIADDHAIVRDGVRALLAQADDMIVVGEAPDGYQAIELSASLQPDLILMDIAMPGLGGLEATTEIRKRVPRAKIIVLSQYGDPEYVRRFLKAGVSGYVLKKAAGADLVAAIRAVVRGGLVLDPEIAREAVQETGAPVDMGSLEVRAKKGFFSVSLTDRLKPYLRGATLEATAIKIPEGRFLIQVEIADRSGGRTVDTFRLEVKAQ